MGAFTRCVGMAVVLYGADRDEAAYPLRYPKALVEIKFSDGCSCIFPVDGFDDGPRSEGIIFESVVLKDLAMDSVVYLVPVPTGESA